MILAHPLAEGCGPFAVPFRSPCGPFAVSRPTNSREHERTQSREAQRFRGCSPVFAGLRGSLSQSGRTVRVGLLMRFSGPLRRVCYGHAAPKPGVPRSQAARRDRVATESRNLVYRAARARSTTRLPPAIAGPIRQIAWLRAPDPAKLLDNQRP
jgi:hypothetical protein